MRGLMRIIVSRAEERKRRINKVKIGVFIGYLSACALVYLFIWRPYVKKLEVAIIRTKSMVTIIPFEIIRQVADIQKYILDNVIFAN